MAAKFSTPPGGVVQTVLGQDGAAGVDAVAKQTPTWMLVAGGAAALAIVVGVVLMVSK